jgi:hypothetical protein
MGELIAVARSLPPPTFEDYAVARGGNLPHVAALSRAAVLEASRAATSASTRVRSTSSGAQRWVGRQQQLGGELADGGQLEPE